MKRRGCIVALCLLITGCPQDRTPGAQIGTAVADDVAFGGFLTDAGVALPELPASLPSPDTGVTSPTDTEVDGGGAQGGAPCQENGPCNDQDSCTVNDVCYGGVCKGEPVSCDDGAPCTVDACTDGACHATLAPGFCLIGGNCVSAGDQNPMSPCQRCLDTLNPTGWSSGDGLPCNDGDPCTTSVCQGGQCLGSPLLCPDDGDPCTQESCQAGGCLSTPIPGCGQPQDECTYHGECNPAGVCAVWQSTGKRKCSKPCAGTLDCPAGQTCTKLPGSANIGYCQDPLPGGFGAGTPCTKDTACASGLCLGICADTCLDQAHCTAAGHTCTLADDLPNGVINTVCFPNSDAYLPNGQACCNAAGQCGGVLCQSGHCNLLGPGPWQCASPCTSEQDCPTAQECNIVLYSPTPNPKTLGFSATQNAKRHDVFLGCYAQAVAGTKPVGVLCNSDSECQSAKCMQLDVSSGAKYCTSFCTDNSECPPALTCKMDAMALQSSWLTSPELQTQGPNSLATTFVRICRTP